jgi:glycosyltransferase involved in cell wall biosynthesis
MKANEIRQGLVSVVIPCYNHGKFLAEAIESVRTQTYGNYEIIVVDDGSSDNSSEVASRFGQVKYVRQQNAGLSAARNTGIDNSSGEYLVFLDADDWLFPDALENNLSHLAADPALAFVSGFHKKVDEWNYETDMDPLSVVSSDHYIHLLRGNYIGMHGAVMYRRWAFDEIRFDTSLRACEDYDVYFKVARKYPVACHDKDIAAYRIHGNNMSSRIPFMLEHVLKVCNKQKALLRNDAERAAYEEGLANWKDYYSDRLFHSLFTRMKQQHAWATGDELSMLLRNDPVRLAKYFKCKLGDSVKKSLKDRLPDRVLKSLHQVGMYKEYTPRPGHVQAGDFHRTTPLSFDFGFDRGGPIDRVYIEHFLQTNKEAIRGTVLEIGDNEYTLKYGEDRVERSEILHVDASNQKATYIGDISDAPQIPTGRFDCIVFTQTLHLIYDFRSALQTCYRILKPGGSLLLTVPGISHIDHGEWKDYWLWSFTDKSIRRLMAESFAEHNVKLDTYGNVYVAAAFLYGMGLPEFKKEFLFQRDPSYQVIISARGIK